MINKKITCLLISIIALLSFISCRKDELNKLFYTRCETIEIKDVSQVKAKLIGKWKWQKATNVWISYYYFADRQTFLEFKLDDTYTIIENDSIIDQGTYSINDESGGFEIEKSGSNLYMYGHIYFCEDLVAFSDMVRDGSNYVFKRTD